MTRTLATGSPSAIPLHHAVEFIVELNEAGRYRRGGGDAATVIRARQLAAGDVRVRTGTSALVGWTEFLRSTMVYKGAEPCRQEWKSRFLDLLATCAVGDVVTTQSGVTGPVTSPSPTEGTR
jgi:hypothetical protein